MAFTVQYPEQLNPDKHESHPPQEEKQSMVIIARKINWNLHCPGRTE